MGILNPSALPFLAVLGVLLLIYLRERWRRRIEVSSLLLWHETREDKVKASRFIPNLLFFLQALLLLLLVGGLLHPYRLLMLTETQGERRILVVDTSASMQAQEGRIRRFEQAIDQAKGVVRAMGPLDEGMIIAISTRPRLLSGFTRDHRYLLHLLENLKPVDTGTNLTLGVEMALAQRDREGRRGRVYVFTDQLKSSLALSPDHLDSVSYHRVGKTDNNLALAALNLHQNPFQSYAQAQAYVLVRNYSFRSKAGTLTVLLNDEPILRRSFTLPPREASSFSVRGFTKPGKLIARIEPEDALSVDNQALAWLAERKERRLVLVSPERSLHEKIRQVCRAVLGLNIAPFLEPAAFEKEALTGEDVVIFHKFVPGEEVPANSLYIFPPPDNLLFPVTEEAADLSILDWRQEHEILRNLRYVEALPLERARVLALPSWAQVLISSRTSKGEVPLALAGEKDGHRVVCLAFDLDKSNLVSSENLTLLVFFLNMVRWLLPPDPLAPVSLSTGETFFLPRSLPQDSPRVILPRGEERPLVTPAVEIEQRGEYRISGTHFSRTLFANLFDETESDIGRQESDEDTPVVLEAKPPQKVARTIPEEFGHFFYYGAVALLGFEWLYALWRYRRTGA
jgi:hypothetical protein